MKIYFAYRTPYKSNLRYLKAFESTSVFDWFMENWDTLCSERYHELLGTEVYGYPIDLSTQTSEVKKGSFLSKLFGKKELQQEISMPRKPGNMQELIYALDQGLYVNEIDGDEQCVRANTDDDEIGLAWFVFSEEYKIANETKVAIWFNESLPVTSGEMGRDLQNDIPVLEEKGTYSGHTYFLSCPIYDGSNLEDMTVVKIEGVRVNTLLDFLKYTELSPIDEVLYAVDELNYLKYIARELDTNDLQVVLNAFARYPVTVLEDTDFNEGSLARIMELDLDTDPDKSSVIVNDHFAEVSINTMEIFHDYYILIDDLWIEKHEILAESILYFGTNWDI